MCLELTTQCQWDQMSDAPRTFDKVYARGFRPQREWERIKPFNVTTDASGSVIITNAMVAHYYKWKDAANRISLSGGGSELREAQHALSFIERVIARHGIKTMLDVPCGDANWQFTSPHIDLIDTYVGLDVAEFPVRLNRRRFAHHTNKHFQRWDLVRCPLPWFRTTCAPSGSPPKAAAAQPFDLIITRDAIQHMPLKYAKKSVAHIATSGAKFLITTTYPNGKANKPNMAPDAFQRSNLHLPPFDFPTAIECVPSHPDAPKTGPLSAERDLLCLYSIDALLKSRGTSEGSRW